MTEHSSTDNIDHLPNWHEQLLFAEELNECMLAGCTGYIYWYMRAHWAFVGTGETKYGTANKKNQLLPRAYVISHFAKNVTGATRLGTSATIGNTTNGQFENSAYIKGDSLIVMAIDTTKTARDLKLKLPYRVKSGVHIVSTGNETANLYQQQTITIDEPVSEITISMPARSLNTFIFQIDETSLAIDDQVQKDDASAITYYDLHGRRIDHPHGLCIEKHSSGFSRMVYIKD